MKHFAGLIAGMAVLIAANAPAATLIVSSTNDSGVGSLRQAVLDNNTSGGGNTIIFSNVVSGIITLTSGELLIASNVMILGPGPGSLAVDGNAAGRVFHITNAATATISGLTITNGAVSGTYPGYLGGGVWNDHSTLTLSNCTITGNYGGDGSGGAIYNDGEIGSATLSIYFSTLNDNSVDGSGGAIYNSGYEGDAVVSICASTLSGNSAAGSGTVGGGVFNDGNFGGATLSVSNSTFTANSAGQQGGAIYDGAAEGIFFTYFTVIASTFSDNTAPDGGSAIFINGGSAVALGDTILKSDGSSTSIISNGGYITSAGYNLSSDNGGALLTNVTDQTNVDPLLGPLADNGGPTYTHALLSGSPAIDKGRSFGLSTDQRGLPRPFDFMSVTNAGGGDGSDIGAFELESPNLNIQQMGGSALLSWPAYYGNYTLQSSTDITSSNNWTMVGGTAAVVGNQYQQTGGPISSNRFFRLQGN